MNALAAPNPYVGPKSFTEDKAAWFFGRERELEELVNRVIAERIVLLYSPSGAGKTSLLQAGLIPALVDEGFRVLPLIRVNQPPGDHARYEPSNRFVLNTLRSLEQGLLERKQPVPDFPVSGETTLKQYLDRLPGNETSEGVSEYDVLIFDQFEEILTIEPTSDAARKERFAFFGQVAEALYDQRRWAVFSLREDYLAGLDTYRMPVPTRLANHFRLDLLRRDDARRAITQPPLASESVAEGDPVTSLQPVTFADDAVSNLLRDLGSSSGPGEDQPLTVEEAVGDALYIEPLHLQVVCYRLWTELKPLPGSVITAEQIEVSGGVDAALGGYYDTKIAAIAAMLAGSGDSMPNADARRAASCELEIRDWFGSELISQQGLRDQVVEEATHSGHLDNRIVDQLVEAKLVNRETRLKAVWYELAHDRLIGPVRASNGRWSSPDLPEVQRKAWIWAYAGKPATGLLGVRGWVTAKRWSRQPGVSLRDHEQEFVSRSGRALVRHHLVRTLPVTALIVFVLVALWQVDQRAENQRENVLTISNGWAGRALSLLPRESRQQEQLDLGLLLAAEAVDYLVGEGIPISFGAKSSLLDGLVVWPYFVAPVNIERHPTTGTPPPETPEASRTEDAPMAVSRDGRTLATTDTAGRVVLVAMPIPSFEAPADVSSPLSLSPDQKAGNVSALTFSHADPSDTVLLVVGYADGALGIWDVTNRHESEQLGTIPPPAVDADCGAALSSVPLPSAPSAPSTPSASPVTVGVTSLTADQGGLLAAGYSDGTIGLWDLSNPANPEELETLRPPGPEIPCRAAVHVLAFNEAVASGQIFAGYTNGGIWSWRHLREDQDQGAVRVDSLPSRTTVEALAVSPDGRFLAFGGQDGLYLRPLDSGESMARSAEPVTALAFNPQDATALFSSHANGEVLRWEMRRADGTAQVPTIRATVAETSGSALVSLVFSPDGQWLVSGATDGMVALWNPLGLPPLGHSVSGSMPAHSSCVASLRFEGNDLVSRGDDGPPETWATDRIQSTSFLAPATRVAGSAVASGLVPGMQPSSASPQAAATPVTGDLASGPCLDGNLLESAELERLGLGPAAPVWMDVNGVPGTSAFGVVRIARSYDGSMLAIGYDSGVIVLLESADDKWELLGQLPGHAGSVTALRFHPGKDYLASGDAHGRVVLWNLQADEWIDFACVRAGRSLTDDEVAEYLNKDQGWVLACVAATVP